MRNGFSPSPIPTTGWLLSRWRPIRDHYSWTSYGLYTIMYLLATYSHHSKPSFAEDIFSPRSQYLLTPGERTPDFLISLALLSQNLHIASATVEQEEGVKSDAHLTSLSSPPSVVKPGVWCRQKNYPMAPWNPKLGTRPQSNSWFQWRDCNDWPSKPEATKPNTENLFCTTIATIWGWNSPNNNVLTCFDINIIFPPLSPQCVNLHTVPYWR